MRGMKEDTRPTETYEPFSSVVRVIKRGRRSLVFSAGESESGVRLSAALEAKRCPSSAPTELPAAAGGAPHRPPPRRMEMAPATISASPRTVEEIFKDYSGRRASLVRAPHLRSVADLET
jgi:hypothetical protein